LSTKRPEQPKDTSELNDLHVLPPLDYARPSYILLSPTVIMNLTYNGAAYILKQSVRYIFLKNIPNNMIL
jgi:hypothetical protein